MPEGKKKGKNEGKNCGKSKFGQENYKNKKPGNPAGPLIDDNIFLFANQYGIKTVNNAIACSKVKCSYQCSISLRIG